MSWMRLIICGMCMGAADIVPGISGGTIAFIMGFYQNLIDSIKNINAKSVYFLLPLVFGIVLAFLTLANFFHFVLQHPVYNVFLYSSFLGLVIASTIFCAKQLQNWKLTHLLSLTVGILLAYFLTGTTLRTENLTYNGFSWWLVFCGATAVSAMLLPGISGSYLLSILGVYPLAIGAVKDFTTSLKQFSFNTEASMILFNLMIGIAIGAALFSRIITWLFTHYHDTTIALLTGFMIGALRSVWPFAGIPDISSPTTFLAFAFSLCGFGLVFFIELASRKAHQAT